MGKSDNKILAEIYIIDKDDNEYLVEDEREYDFYFKTFSKFLKVNVGIAVKSNKGDQIIIESRFIKTVYIIDGYMLNVILIGDSQ